ncbi:hypothetical protein L1049_028438 [Liquidambar formosana]|uniref:Uncharacterized protein n=1 Tax=Liquidambar formosana TaxID=63359 RepID=A0AAP0WTA9_LIQFO
MRRSQVSFEVVCLEARRIIAEREMLFSESERGDEEIQFDIDCEDAEVDLTPKISDLSQKISGDILKKGSFHYSFKGVNGWNPLSKLEESIEEDEIEVDEEPARAERIISQQDWDHFSSVSKLSMSFKKIGLGEIGQPYHGGKPDGAHIVGTSSGTRRSANEQLPATTSFVKLADMNEEAWNFVP